MNAELGFIRVEQRPGSRIRGRFNRAMQRVDAGYLYELGDAIKSVHALRLKSIPAYEAWSTLTRARQKLNEFITSSVFSRSLRPLQAQAVAFTGAIDGLIARIANDNLDPVGAIDLLPLSNAYDRFEPAFANELSYLVTYLVMPKGAYDIVRLVETGQDVFPESVWHKAPEAVRDLQEGTKSLAFELWTAAAFHFHRGNEAVLRRYYDAEMGVGKRSATETMGTLLSKLKKAGKGDAQVIVALENLKDFHRNPTIHPGEFVEDVEHTLSLVSAIRAAMGYMLDRLPGYAFTDLEETPTPDFALEPTEPQEVERA